MILVLIIVVLVLSFSGILYYRETNHISLVSKEYDKYLNNLMDNNTPIKENYLTVKFKNSNFDIWTGNYPYAYGYMYPDSSCYPSMKTRKRLRKYIMRKKFENI